jgi:hypothetical protein
MSTGDGWRLCFSRERYAVESEARQCIERAFRHHQGSDETSKRSRQALGLLIEAMLTAECALARMAATILPFLVPTEPLEDCLRQRAPKIV